LLTRLASQSNAEPVLDTSTNTPVGAYALLQKADRTNFGMPLAPGSYRSITTTHTR
jgi:hypothetical protein